ncbi:Zn(2)-C6 fungal-type domain-containing protein [Fusarium sp. LHS14.1]|nr:Zn(2)-C6 fungal-type domain-containing protein [Fusarium sp. LHS14.1]
MPLGPFDRRKKRSRCLACSASHLKCSGTLPCSNCQRRQIICDFSPVLNKVARIKIDHGNHATAVGLVNSYCRHAPPKLVITPRADKTSYFFRYFDTFLLRNKFTQKNMYPTDIVELIQRSSSGEYLRDAVLSVGAMQATKSRSAESIDSQESYRFAVSHYSKSVAGLRSALNQFASLPNLRHSILWTTHLLGLFELMSDTTGQGWVQHLVHGTSSALVATGPLAFETGLGKRFFTEIRIFEVCRAIIFNEPTFLANAGWQELSAKLQDVEDGQSHPLDALLDIVVLCSTLRVRASNLICSLQDDQLAGIPDEARDIAAEGFRLRQALTLWQLNRRASTPSPNPNGETTADDDFLSLAEVFYSATSIYLSGVFDYEIVHWQSMSIPVPNLSEEEIQTHVSTILVLSGMILDSSKISSVLVLFPLRVAGARSWDQWQHDCIIELLERIEQTFPVASAFRTDLGALWTSRC